MKKNMMFLMILASVILLSFSCLADIKEFYAYSYDSREGNCGGACPDDSGTPHPQIMDRNDTNSCTGGAKYFCDCGWTGAACQYNDDNITISFVSEINFPANSITISLNDCDDHPWDTYQVFSVEGSELTPITSLMTQRAASDCENNMQTLEHPSFSASTIMLYAKANSSSDTDGSIYIQEIFFGDSEEERDCAYPSIFCDDFDYSSPMLTRDWKIYDESFRINYSFSPVSNELNLRQTGKYLLCSHEVPSFPSSYITGPNEMVSGSVYAPVFSSEFTLTVYNNSGDCFNYEGYDSALSTVFDLYFCSNQSVYYYATDAEQSDFYITVCESCLDYEAENEIKISSFFEHDYYYPFNSSIKDSHVKLFINGQLKSSNIPFVSNASLNLKKYNFIKDYDSNATVDDYYVMVGLDRYIDTSDYYYSDFFSNETEITTTIEGGKSKDMAQAVSSIWNDMGLITTTSKIIAGLFLMFLLAIGLYIVSLSMSVHISASVLMIIEIFFALLLTFIKLLPIWVPFILVLLSAGVGALSIKYGASA